jgi:hypothetical protein
MYSLLRLCLAPDTPGTGPVFTRCGKNTILLPALRLLGSSGEVILPNVNVYGHITLNTPVLVRSLKLSKVELC